MPSFLQQTRQALQAFIAQRLPDNTEQLITPLALRTVLLAMVESMWVKLTDLLAGPNKRPDLLKAVRWYSEDAPGYDEDGPTLADLDPATMCLYTSISCDFGPEGKKAQYVLVPAEAGAEGAFEVFRDASFEGPKMWVTFALADSARAATSGIPEFNPYGPEKGYYAGPDENGNNAEQVTHQDKIWRTTMRLDRELFDGGLIPAPGTPAGAAYWRELSPTPVTHLQNTDRGTTQAAFTIGLNSQSQGTTEYRLLGFLADAQRPNVMLAARWTPQQAGDLVELVQCLDYVAPATRPGNVWTRVGGADVSPLYIEDSTLVQEINGQEHSLNLAPLLPALKPSKKLWLVHAAGQTGGDGSFESPYATIQAAITAAGAFDTILVAGGTYAPNLSITKSLTLIALGEVTLSGEVNIGAYPQLGTGLTVRLQGFTLANRTVVIRQIGPTANHTVTIDRCTLSGVGYMEHYGIGTDHAVVDTVRLLSMRGLGKFAFNEHSSYGQGCAVYVTDCQLHAPAAVFSGTANASSHIYLEGDTRLSAPIQSCTRNGALLTDAELVTDNRATDSFVPVLASELVAGALNIAGLNLRATIIELVNAFASTTPGNQLPVSNAGADTMVTLPTTSVVLAGSGTDADGSIVGYSWSQVTGPNTAVLTNASTATATASGLVEGIYQFRLTVTDNTGGSATDDRMVTVQAQATEQSYAPTQSQWAANVDYVSEVGQDGTVYYRTNPYAYTRFRANGSVVRIGFYTSFSPNQGIGLMCYRVFGANGVLKRTKQVIPYGDPRQLNYFEVTGLVAGDIVEMTNSGHARNADLGWPARFGTYLVDVRAYEPVEFLAPVPRTHKIVIAGDSNTQGEGSSLPFKDSFAMIFRAALEGMDCELMVSGAGGLAIKDVWNGSTRQNEWIGMFADAQVGVPGLFIVYDILGTNDSEVYPDQSKAEFKTNHGEYMDGLHNTLGNAAIITTVTPFITTKPSIIALAAEKKAAKVENKQNNRTWLSLLDGEQMTDASGLTSDQIHLNNGKGHPDIAAALLTHAQTLITSGPTVVFSGGGRLECGTKLNHPYVRYYPSDDDWNFDGVSDGSASAGNYAWTNHPEGAVEIDVEMTETDFGGITVEGQDRATYGCLVNGQNDPNGGGVQNAPTNITPRALSTTTRRPLGNYTIRYPIVAGSLLFVDFWDTRIS